MKIMHKLLLRIIFLSIMFNLLFCFILMKNEDDSITIYGKFIFISIVTILYGLFLWTHRTEDGKVSYKIFR